MSLAPHSPSSEDALPTTLLSALTYRSRATGGLAPAELDRLAQAARQRNRAEGVSTLMLFDGEQIFQWLEGPPDALERIWASVQRDPRHTSIEVLGRHSTPVRFFDDFELEVARRPAPRHEGPRTEGATANELARSAIAQDPDALASTLRAGTGRRAASNALLFEKAARQLGDLWQADDCSEVEVTLGLGHLQRCLRRSDADAAQRQVVEGSPVVLIAPLPGEPHLLGAALDADAMWRAGWHPRIEFPGDTAVLCALLSRHAFDVLDLSLSAAFRREHWLPRLKQVIEHARSASRNPDLVIVAGGRLFGEQPEAAAAVGADEPIRSSATAESSIVRALAARQSSLAWV